jgi:hypothetical protein
LKFSIAFHVAGGQLFALMSGRSVAGALVSNTSTDLLFVIKGKNESMAESIIVAKMPLNNLDKGK